MTPTYEHDGGLPGLNGIDRIVSVEGLYSGQSKTPITTYDGLISIMASFSMTMITNNENEGASRYHVTNSSFMGLWSPYWDLGMSVFVPALGQAYGQIMYKVIGQSGAVYDGLWIHNTQNSNLYFGLYNESAQRLTQFVIQERGTNVPRPGNTFRPGGHLAPR